MSAYTVRAERWEGGWELYVEGLGVTQSRTLADAEKTARDYIESVKDADLGPDDSIDLHIRLEGELTERLTEARGATRAAADAQARAADETRATVRRLREAGLSVADVATLMDVSPGRVSQIMKVAAGGSYGSRSAATGLSTKTREADSQGSSKKLVNS